MERDKEANYTLVSAVGKELRGKGAQGVVRWERECHSKIAEELAEKVMFKQMLAVWLILLLAVESSSCQHLNIPIQSAYKCSFVCSICISTYRDAHVCEGVLVGLVPDIPDVRAPLPPWLSTQLASNIVLPLLLSPEVWHFPLFPFFFFFLSLLWIRIYSITNSCSWLQISLTILLYWNWC